VKVITEFRSSLRFFVFNVGNESLELETLRRVEYFHKIFSDSYGFASLFAVFNNNLNIEECYGGGFKSVGEARKRAAYYILEYCGYTNSDLSISASEKKWGGGLDFRDSLSELAFGLSRKWINDNGFSEIAVDEWKFDASELEMIFSVYLNNLEIDEERKPVNNRYSLSRVVDFILCLFDDSYSPDEAIEVWETKLW